MAAKKKTATPPGDAYYAAMLQGKVLAGLSLAAATEVTARQRAEDEANGVTLSEPETEEIPEA